MPSKKNVNGSRTNLAKVVARTVHNTPETNEPKFPSSRAKEKSEVIANRNLTNRAVEELLPDTKLLSKVLIASIMSPKNLQSTDMVFKTKEVERAPGLAVQFNSLIERHFVDQLDINGQTSTILHDILFARGSHTRIILPSTAIDKVINSDELVISKESMATVEKIYGEDGSTAPMGFIGDSSETNTQSPFRLSSESYGMPNSTDETLDGSCVMADNFEALKAPLVADLLLKQNVQDRLNISPEAMRFKVDPEGGRILKPREYEEAPLQEVPSAKGKPRGHPMVINPSNEAVLPVTLGPNTKPVGLIVLIDALGNPISLGSDITEYERMLTEVENSETKRLKELYRKFKIDAPTSSMHDATKNKSGIFVEQYISHVQGEMITRLKKGIYPESVTVATPIEVYSIMMSRALAAKKTTALFVPMEMCNYMTFEKDSDGVGVSLHHKSAGLASMRVVLQQANVDAAIANSTPNTKLNIELDPADPAPDKTVAKLKKLHLEQQMSKSHEGLTNLRGVSKYLKQVGVTVEVSGHPGYPTTKMSVDDNSRSKVTVDTDLSQKLSREHAMAYGVPPQLIGSDLEVDFASVYDGTSVLFNKTIVSYQVPFERQTVDFIRKYIQADGTLRDEIYRLIDRSKSKASKISIYRELLANLSVCLPRPDSNKLESDAKSVDAYISLLDIALENNVSEDMLLGMLDSDLEDSVEAVVPILRSHFIRNYMRTNNIMPEVSGVLGKKSDPNSAISILIRHEEQMGSLLGTLSETTRTILEHGRTHTTNVEDDEAEYEERVEEEKRLAGETNPEETTQVEPETTVEPTEVEPEAEAAITDDDFSPPV